MITSNTPRGIRNNNPGNVEYNSRTLWNGLAKPPTDGRFCRFTAPQYGLRVISKLLLAYSDFHGDKSVADFIHRWAPPVENDTGAYVQAVASRLNVPATVAINIHVSSIRAAVVAAIVMQENGEQPYAHDLIVSACEMS